MEATSGKKYGLITRQHVKKSAVLLPKLAAFGDSSDEEESAHAAVNQSLQFEARKQKVKKQTQLEIQRALEEDPTVYEYDSVYDSMQQNKMEKLQAKKAAKDSKDKPSAGNYRASWKQDKIEMLMKILLISHDKYVHAKSTFKVSEFYAEIGAMIAHSGNKVENLLKNLGREYREAVWQTEENQSQGLAFSPRLRGSEKLHSLFCEFTQLYGLLTEKRNKMPLSSQGVTEAEVRPLVDDGGSAMVHETLAGDGHGEFVDLTLVDESPSGSSSSQPFPVQVHRDMMYPEPESQEPLQNEDSLSNSNSLHPATSSTMPDVSTDHRHEPTTKKRRKSADQFSGSQSRQRVRSPVFNRRSPKGKLPKLTSPWRSIGPGRKRRAEGGYRDGPRHGTPKRTCDCQEKRSKFENQLLDVLSGIGQELQLLRRGFFTVYDIKEEESEDVNSGEDNFSDDIDEGNEEGEVQDNERPTPCNFVFP